jgi:hypothetical protein
MDMGTAATGRLAEVAAGQIVVVAAQGEPTRLDRFAEGTQRFERGDRDLDIDDRLGGQAGNRGRADVIDAQRDLAESGPQVSSQRGEQLRPGRVVIDHDPHIDCGLGEIAACHIRKL